MKKLNKKTKLIVLIAIILVAVILAIVITTNIINNGQVASEGYLATTANANSNLVAGYIKEGITIGGITGTLESLNTFDATATAEDISWGETAYVKGEKITGTKIITIAHAKEAQKVFEENTVLIDDYGNRVKVPVGFKIVEDSATSVAGGVVIEDVSAEGVTEYTKGSQFVWVPIGQINNDENIISITLGRYTFNDDGTEHLEQSAENWRKEGIIETYYKELSVSSYGNATAKNLEEFITKTTQSGGYYIGRYEAGDAYATDSARTGTIDVSNATNPITCKAGVYPYTFINENDSSALCRQMYNSIEFESDLINSYAWDTAIVFIQKFSGDANYSKQIGKNTANDVQKCGTSILDIVDNESEKNDIRCNIYDMAGNCVEWTTETSIRINYESSHPYYHYVGRGGRCTYDSQITSGRYYSYLNNCFSTGSARPILYL